MLPHWMRLYRKQIRILHLSTSALLHLVSKQRPPSSSIGFHPLTTTYEACLNGYERRYGSISNYSSKPTGSSSRAYKKRVNKRLRLASKPVLNEASFEKAKSLLPPRFTADHLHDIIIDEDDPLKLGAAKMYEEMDNVVNQVLAVPHIGSEGLYNTIIYYFTAARRLTRSVVIFKHMKDCNNLECRPSIKTYNILFAAFLSRKSNTHVNHMYMETMNCLFRQLISDGIEPDIFSLNCMIKGYVMSNHVNDALRIFHQLSGVYKCQPNAASYDCIVHGLCAQGRTRNARELWKEMQGKGFGLSAKTYNSLVNALSLNGDVEEAVQYLREMALKKKEADFITYRTVVDQLCRQGKVREAKLLLEEFKGKVDGPSYKKLLSVLQDDFAYGRSSIELGRKTVTWNRGILSSQIVGQSVSSINCRKHGETKC
nr:pentatricopeptide repeat-containing protein [Fagopyrum tataricum]